RDFHSRAELGGALFTPTSAEFPAQPPFCFEQSRPMKPRGQGIVGSELPGLARQGRENVLSDLFCGSLVFDLSHRRAVNEIEMPAYYRCKSLLISVSGEIPQQFKICAPVAHLTHRLPLRPQNRTHFYECARILDPQVPLRCRTDRRTLASSLSRSF